jgi:TM2 domain-containing membrane protein YozV
MAGDDTTKKKSRFLSFLLAIFLGPLGFHNFYLGRWKRGFIQFFLVILTFGAGLVITWPWAWMEGFLILIGKYSLSPPKIDEGAGDDVDTTHPQGKKVRPIVEYIITFLLLVSLWILFVPSFGFVLLIAALIYWFVGGIWNKLTKLFIKTLLPIYATVFSSGKKFLIRFSEYSLPTTKTRAELFRATRKLSLTAVFVLLFAISLIAQSNISLVAEGKAPNAVICMDGTIKLDKISCDEYDSTISQDFESCDSTCVLENTQVPERIIEVYTDPTVIVVLLFAPLLTVLVAPILVLKFSSLSIVDKKTRSMSPIGEKANDLTNVGAGFGSLVLFFQTAWRISSSGTESGDYLQMFAHISMIFFFTGFMVLMFYPLVWLPMLKFTKSLESHVMLLDNSLVEKKGIEIHELTYENNELRITPKGSVSTTKSEVPQMISTESTMQPQQMTSQVDDEASMTLSASHVSQVLPVTSSGPSIDMNPESTDQHGYEWIKHNHEDYYREIGLKEEWTKFQN